MRYAIDRFQLGAEKEVSADTFYAINIRSKNTRFFCPECGEPVFWSSRGGSQPDKFSHYNKTEWSPECDRRVDGRSELNLYERIGLPVYLTVGAANQFRLNIGFPAIGERLLAESASRDTIIRILGAEYQRTIFVNSTNFLENDISLIPVDFIPHLQKNFIIQIESTGETRELQKRWSDYADGFQDGGAIFTYEETGGKKVRRGDSISPDRLYYVIARQSYLSSEEICFQVLGTISLNRKTYKVYLMRIKVSIENSDRFSTINNYLNKHFGVWLLQTSPELIPLWPPVIERGTMIPIKTHSKIYCSVSSSNDLPNVYLYNGSESSQICVEKDCRGNKTVSFDIYERDMTISVDRKYVGREITFEGKTIVSSDFTYNISLETKKGVSISLNEVTKEIFSTGFLVKANAKMEMYIGSHDKIYQHISIRDYNVTVPEKHNSEEILFAIEDSILFHVRASAIFSNKDLNEQAIMDRIRKCSIGKEVRAPYWIGKLLLVWHKKGYYEMVSAVHRTICNGKIPIGLLKLLLELK